MNLAERIGGTWLGTEASLKYLEEVHLKLLSPEFDKKLFIDDEDEDEDELPRYIKNMVQEVSEGVAIVTIRGPMVAGSAGWWGSYFGFVGYDDIRSAVNYAKQDLNAESIVMDYGTPGGSTLGIEELSTFLADQPELISYSGSQVTSGGIWLASTADKFYTTKMAEVGSVGVIAVTSELTEYFKKEGRSVKVFKSATLKAAGNPYEKLSEEQAREIQASVDKTHQFFIDHLAESLDLSKPYVASEIATGQVWFGEEARDKGLTTGIMSLEGILSLAMTSQIEDNSQQQQNSINFQGLTSMTKKTDLKDDNNTSLESEGTTKDAEALALAAAGVEILEGKVEESTETAEPETKVEEEVTTKVEEEGNTTSLMDQMVDLKVDLKEAQNKISSMETDHSGMKEVLVSVIQNTSVALGSPAPSKDVLGATGVSALLQQYSQLAAQLNERFGAGGRKSAEAESSDGDVEQAAQQTESVYLKLAKIK